MYSIKNLLQSAQLRQALTRKASNVVSATSTPWIAGATFMGKAPSQAATQMQYVAANSIHSSLNMAQQTAVQQAAVPMSWGAVAQPSVAPLGNPAGQPTMVMAPQSIPQQAAAPQTRATASVPASDADSTADSAPIAHARSEKWLHLSRPNEKARSLYAASS